VFFLIPWYGCTLLGTTDTDFDGDPEDATVERADIDYLLSEATRVLPVGPWTRDSVLGSFVGVRALRDDSDRPPSQLSREWTIDEPLRGLFVSTGGKFTSARADAARIVDRVMQRLGRDPTGRPPTRSRPLPWCPPGDFAGWFADAVAGGVGVGFDAETAGEAAYRYGTTVTDVHEIAREHPELAARVVEDLPFSKAEVIHAARNEMAVYLEDIVRRRIPLSILTRLDARSLERVASLAAPVLGWDTERRNEEVEAVVRSLSRHGRPPNDA
jgi:glycerol-3-phosphate dehydrogenase